MKVKILPLLKRKKSKKSILSATFKKYVLLDIPHLRYITNFLLGLCSLKVENLNDCAGVFILTLYQ